jgi:hypothetical protein
LPLSCWSANDWPLMSEPEKSLPPPLTASAGAAQASTVASAQAAIGTRKELSQESCGVGTARDRRWDAA